MTVYSALRRASRQLPGPVRRAGRAVLARLRGPGPVGAWVTLGHFPSFAERAETYRAVGAEGGTVRAHDGSVFVGRYADLQAVLKDSERFSSAPLADFNPVFGGDEGERHAAARRPLVAALSPRALAGRGGWIRETARATLRQMRERSDPDLLAGFTEPFVLRLLADLLGLDDQPTDRLVAWSPHVGRFMAEGPTAAAEPDRSFRAAAAAAFDRAHQAGPPTVVKGLVGVPQAVTSPEAFERAVALVFYAGLVTTRMTIVNVVHALLDHPAAEAEVRRDRSRLGALIAETLRLRPPDVVMRRVAMSDGRVGPVRVAPGTSVYGLTEMANRDPHVFDDPEAFRLDRSTSSLAFGHGPHYCPGHFWATEEITGAIDVVLDAWPSLQDALDPAERPGPFLTRDPGPLRFQAPPEA